jgi:hypothetical protein
MLGSPLTITNASVKSSLGHNKPVLLPKLKYDSKRLDTIRQEKDSQPDTPHFELISKKKNVSIPH